ncbi:MAG TPA: hypothetical protein VH912_14980 [Streptosporangiaceae bacterium]|jgi:hypothetical protein
MYDHQRRRHSRRRDSGLAQIGAWTRRSIAAGVVLAAGLAAWAAHALPGQAASSSSPQAPPSESSTSGEPSPTVSDDGGGLAPPYQPPAPSHGRSHVTSGGS